jgi:hypothetical protein
MGHLDTHNRVLEMQGKISKPSYKKGIVQTLQNKLTSVNGGLCPVDLENSHIALFSYRITYLHNYFVLLETRISFGNVVYDPVI